MYWQQNNAGCHFINITGKENVLVSDTLLTYVKKLIMRITVAIFYTINNVERVSLLHAFVPGLLMTLSHDVTHMEHIFK